MNIDNTEDIKALLKARAIMLDAPAMDRHLLNGQVWDNGEYYEFTGGECTKYIDYRL